MRSAFRAAALLLCFTESAAADGLGPPSPALAAKLERLRHAYPDTVRGWEGNALLLADGHRLTISDGKRDKTPAQLLARPDIDDMFAYPYPSGEPLRAPKRDADPGRVRVDALFRALYGDCRKGEVQGRMRRVAWVPGHKGGTVTITAAQGADKALEAVSRDLDRLPASFARFLVPTAGTYNCRAIAGTDRPSMHGYGAAIDLSTDYADYWRWSGKGDAVPQWKNRMPPEIVAIFERHGFVWGGRWHHFDTAHFEYRPELAGGE